MTDRCFIVYRYFDAEGQLLYVGSTIRAGKRMREHVKHSSWFHEVRSSTVEHFPSVDAMLEAELRAIVEEHPRYNVKHKQKKAPAPETSSEAAKSLAQKMGLHSSLYDVRKIVEHTRLSPEIVEEALESGELAQVQVYGKTKKGRRATDWTLAPWLEGLERAGLWSRSQLRRSV